MAYTPIPAADIEVGKPTKKSLFQTIKDNEDDHESRIATLTAGANKVVVFSMEMANMFQYVNATGALERVALFKASSDFSIVNAQIYVLHGGPNGDVPPTAGTLEVDIKKGTSLSALNTIFTVKPAVTTFGDGDTNGSVTFTPGGEVVDQGDWLQLNITNLQTGQTRYIDPVFYWHRCILVYKKTILGIAVLHQ